MLPHDFIERMKVLLGEESDAFLASYKEPPSSGLRVNTLKVSPEAFSQISPFPLTPIPWTKVGFTLPPECRPGTHPYHTAGLYYLQDPSAMAVTEVLDPQPGERILDLAAAPGGKTTHIAARMENQGLLVANDINYSRVRDLYNNIERWGAQNIVVVNETPQRLADHFGPFFDKVLVDAPCSGEGMFRKDPDAIYEWNPRMVESCANRQDEILDDAARMVRPGGRLVYSTCTFAPEEDESSVWRFLRTNPNFDLEEVDQREGFYPGRPDWFMEHDPAVIEAGPEILSRTIRLWPHLGPGEGHFIAVMHNKEVPAKSHYSPKYLQRSTLSREFKAYFEAFAKETLNTDVFADELSLQGAFLYRVPADMPELQGLRVIHWGSWLGVFKTRRFEPSQAFVMGLSPEDVRHVCDFPLEDPRLESYLRGEVLSQSGPDGWIMVAVDGYPLGWAKRVQSRLKPRFPRWLRLVGERWQP